jgi:hypothetical protein
VPASVSIPPIQGTKRPLADLSNTSSPASSPLLPTNQPTGSLVDKRPRITAPEYNILPSGRSPIGRPRLAARRIEPIRTFYRPLAPCPPPAPQRPVSQSAHPLAPSIAILPSSGPPAPQQVSLPPCQCQVPRPVATNIPPAPPVIHNQIPDFNPREEPFPGYAVQDGATIEDRVRWAMACLQKVGFGSVKDLYSACMLGDFTTAESRRMQRNMWSNEIPSLFNTFEAAAERKKYNPEHLEKYDEGVMACANGVIRREFSRFCKSKDNYLCQPVTEITAELLASNVMAKSLEIFQDEVFGICSSFFTLLILTKDPTNFVRFQNHDQQL